MKESVDLKGNYGSRKETNGARKLVKVEKQAWRVVQLDHGYTSGNVNRIDVISWKKQTKSDSVTQIIQTKTYHRLKG